MEFQTSSPSWIERVYLIATTLLSGGFLLGIFRLWFGRKTADSQIHKTDAETENTRIDGAIQASEQILLLTDKLSRLQQSSGESVREAIRQRDEALARLDEAHRESTEQTEFYRGQIVRFEERIDYFTKLDLAYRNRSHAINNEFAKAVMAYRMLESEAEKEGRRIPPLSIKDLGKLTDEFPLPKEPKEV